MIKFIITITLHITIFALLLWIFDCYPNYYPPKTPQEAQGGKHDFGITIYNDSLKLLTHWNLKTKTKLKNAVDTVTVGEPFDLKLSFNSDSMIWFSGDSPKTVVAKLLTSSPYYLDTAYFKSYREATIQNSTNLFSWNVRPIEEGRAIIQAKLEFGTKECHGKINGGIVKEVELYIQPEKNNLVFISRWLKNIILNNKLIMLFSFAITFGIGYFNRFVYFFEYIKNAIHFLIFKRIYVMPNIDRAKVLVANDHLKEVFPHLREIVHERYVDEIILLEGRLSHIDSEQRRGVIDRDAYMRSRAELRANILDLIKTINENKKINMH